MNVMIMRVLIFAALLAAGSGLPPRAAREKRLTIEQIIRRWADGPIRYLMTSREDQQSRELKSVPELARYITKFWARRDPTPGTLENEYRRTYWGRVLEADRRFRDSTIPGWKTDRGKVFILLGEPDDIFRDDYPKVQAGLDRQNTEVGSSSAGRKGIERWTYRRGQARTASPEFVVAFIRDEAFDWRLSTNAELIGPNFPGSSTLGERDPTFGGIENAPKMPPASDSGGGQLARDLPSIAQESSALDQYSQVDTSVLANYDLGLEMSLPSSSEAVIATVTAHEFLSAFSATARFEYFRAQDGSTFINVGALVQARDLYGDATSGKSDLRIYASFTPVVAGGQLRYATNEKAPAHIDLSSGPPPGACFDVWTGLALPPGRYHATVAIEDTMTGRLGRSSADIEVPDFTHPGPRLSTVLLASSLSETGGRLGVTTRPSGVFRKSESMGIYYEVYGLEGGAAGAREGQKGARPGEGTPKEGGLEGHSASGGSAASEGSSGSPSARFDVSYQFYREVGDAVAPMGKPILFSERTEAVQGWSFPLARWPAGHYRIEVTVTDSQGRTASAQVPFEVTD